MIKSMTGYGKAESSHDQGKITVEMRAVNHRYGEISVKLPRSLVCFENEVRKVVSGRLKRGKIDVFIQLDTVAAGRPPVVNSALARAYYTAFSALSDDLGICEPIPLSLIVSQRDVLAVAENDVEADSMREELLAVVEQAVGAMETMRLREGQELNEDLRARRGSLSRFIDGIARRASLVPAEYAEKLSLRLAQFEVKNMPDESRVAQEVVLMADRCDITEELVRFASHLVQFDAALESLEPVGRKLDFLLQELGREVNTIGSKANDSEIAACVVELKVELEKIREQVQNIE